MLNEMYITVCNMSITAIFVIMLVFTLRIFLKKSSRTAVYYLWGIVGFRLACPISVSSAFSFFNLPILRNISATGNELSWQQTADLSVPHVWNVQAPGAEPVVESIIVDGVKEELIYDPQPLFSIGVTDIKAILWIAVCALILIYQAYSYVKLKRNLEMAVKVEGNIYECDKIQSPFVLGVFRPKIYLPFHLTGEEKNFVLEHERYHINRRDYLAKIFAIFLLALHWFNPYVWLAYYLFCKDMEMSCDEYVIAKLGTDKKQEYSNTLLMFATGRKRWALGTLAFGETSVFDRVQSILKYKKPAKFILGIAFGISMIVAVIALTNGQKDNVIKRSKTKADGTIEYQYSLSNDIKSILMYKEYYQYGELKEYGVEMFGSVGEKDVAPKGEFQFSMSLIEDENGLQCLDFIIGDEVKTSLRNNLEVYGYQAVARTFYLENSSAWQKIESEQDIVVAAFNLDDGTGVRGYSCEAYQKDKFKLVSDNSGVVLYHLVLSEKDVNELIKEFEKPTIITEWYEAKNPYIGNHVADGKLLSSLGVPGLGNYTMELQSSEKPYGLILHFEKYPDNEMKLHMEMLKKSALFLTLTENAGYVEWSYPDNNKSDQVQHRYYVEHIEQMLGINDIKSYAESEDDFEQLTSEIMSWDWFIAETNYVHKPVTSGKRPYTYKELITGRHPNAESDSTYLVYSYEKIRFEDITNYLFGSQYPKEKEMYVVNQP